MTESPNRRERKKQATRQALHRAATALITERGLAGVTIEAITERADVAPRTFFNYFSSKEEAAIGRDPEEVGRLCETLRTHLQTMTSPFDALHVSMRETAITGGLRGRELRERHRLITSEPGLIATAMAQWEAMEQALRTTVAAHLGLDADHDVYPGLLVTSAVGARRTALFIWSAEGSDRTLTELIDETFSLLATGLPAPPESTQVVAAV